MAQLKALEILKSRHDFLLKKFDTERTPSESLAYELVEVIRLKEAISELETPIECKNCKFYLPDDGLSCGHDDVLDWDVPSYLNFSGCGLHELRS